MLRSTSTSTSLSTMPAPGGNPASNSAIRFKDISDKQTSAEQNIQSSIAKLDAARIKNAALTKQINDSIGKKESHEAKLKSYNKEIEINQAQAHKNIEKLIDSNVSKLQTSGPSTTLTQHGHIDKNILQQLMKNDPNCIKLASQLKTITEKAGKENKTINQIQKDIDLISRQKATSSKNLENSKTDLNRCIHDLQTTKAGAANEIELEHLLSVANQRICATNFSIEEENVAQAQRNLSGTQSSVNDSVKKLDNLMEKMQAQQAELDSAHQIFKSSAYQNSVTDFDKKAFQTAYLSQPKYQMITYALVALLKDFQQETVRGNIISSHHTKAQNDLTEATAKLHEAEKVLKEANCAVETAQLALDQYILETTLLSSDPAPVSTNEAPTPVAAGSDALEDNHFDGQVTMVGLDDHLELV